MKKVLSFILIFCAVAAFCQSNDYVKIVVATPAYEVTETMEGSWIKGPPELRLFLKKDAQSLIFTEFQVIEISKDISGNDLAYFYPYPDDSKRFAEFTKNNVGKQVACFIGEKFFVAPVIFQPIPDGTIAISGKFEQKDKELLAKLNRGKKRVTVNPSWRQKTPERVGLIGLLYFFLTNNNY